MICVLATIELVPGRHDAFLAAVREILGKVKAEHGCLQYQPLVDLPSRLSDRAPRENVVVIVEQWESLSALEAHLKSSHMDEFRKTTKPWRVQTKLEVLQPA